MPPEHSEMSIEDLVFYSRLSFASSIFIGFIALIVTLMGANLVSVSVGFIVLLVALLLAVNAMSLHEKAEAQRKSLLNDIVQKDLAEDSKHED